MPRPYKVHRDFGQRVLLLAKEYQILPNFRKAKRVDTKPFGFCFTSLTTRRDSLGCGHHRGTRAKIGAAPSEEQRNLMRIRHLSQRTHFDWKRQSGNVLIVSQTVACTEKTTPTILIRC